MLDMYLLSYIFIPYLIFLILLCQKDFQYRSSTVCTASALCLRRPRVAFLISRVYILTIIVKIQYIFIPAWEHLKILSTARTTIILCWVEIIKLYVGRKIFPPRYSRDRPARTVDYLGDACCVALRPKVYLIFNFYPHRNKMDLIVLKS